MENANFEFENFIKKWEKDIENKISKTENSENEYFIFPALQYLKMKILALHLFYIKNPSKKKNQTPS